MHMTNTCRLLLLGASTLLTSCSLLDRNPKPAAKGREHPMLAAARAGEITLFGDLHDRDAEEYYSRSAISLKRHTFAEIGGDNDADVTSDGTRLVFSSTRHNIRPDLYVKTVDGTAVTQLTSDPASDVQAVFSPDDGRVAFTSDRTGNWDIWVFGLDGGQPFQITSGLADEVHPSWSPDGSKIVYCSLPMRGGQWELWIADIRGGSGKKFIGYGLFPVWSPLGDKILYQRARERGSNLFSIWTVTLVDGEPRYPTEVASTAHEAYVLPAWSVDARQIAFSSVNEPGPDELSLPSSEAPMDIWTMWADGSGKVRLTDGHTGNFAPVFAPNGRLFFTTRRSGQENIWSLLPGTQGTVSPGGGSLTGDPRPSANWSGIELGRSHANDLTKGGS